MMERTEISIYIGLSTLFIALIILAILVYRRGHQHDTHKIIEAIQGSRQQSTVFQDKMETEVRTIKTWLLKIMNRFGFIDKS